ncbi:MAG: hypothetical protein P8Y70_07045 [Candidatus Lokiarchaeota archaeon]
MKAVTAFMAWAGIITPTWLNEAATISLFGASGIMSTALGFWCIVAGIGLFREQEWALGQGLVITSLMVVDSVTTIVTWITTMTFDYTYWGNYVTMVVFLVGLLGFFWLLFTTKRYD